MWGFMLALLYAAYLYFVSPSIETAYLGSTELLFRWHLIWSIIFGVIVLLANLLMLFAGAAAGSIAGPVGALVGFIIGVSASLFISALFLFRRCLYVGGAYLLSTALVLQNSSYTWDTVRLILGAVIFLVAILTSRIRASS